MNSADFWTSVKNIIDDGFTSEGLQNLIIMQKYLLGKDLYINDFHRKNSMAAQREVLYMSLHPYSREQKIAQIQSLKEGRNSKENSNMQRNKLAQLNNGQ